VVAEEAWIDHPTHETVTGFLDAVRALTPSWTWRVSQEQLDAALDVGRRWTVERFGSTDIRLEERIRQRWWVFEVS
jgi:GH24 family phage-related lysozyme (muramidase)